MIYLCMLHCRVFHSAEKIYINILVIIIMQKTDSVGGVYKRVFDIETPLYQQCSSYNWIHVQKIIKKMGLF